LLSHFKLCTIFSAILAHNINSFATECLRRSFGAQVLIDDNPRYALECAEDGMRVLLFDYDNSYPWCKTGVDQSHPLVTKVHNWQEVEQKLLSWVAPES
jgi:5'(3')-deoxyribonucleotidase